MPHTKNNHKEKDEDVEAGHDAAIPAKPKARHDFDLEDPELDPHPDKLDEEDPEAEGDDSEDEGVLDDEEIDPFGDKWEE